jgi:histidinol-phosphate aminotransferase
VNDQMPRTPSRPPAGAPRPKPRPIPALEALPAYKVPRHPAPVDLMLDGNEGLAPPASLLAELAAGGPELLRRYPSPAGLEARLAARLGVSPGRVIVTAGADDAIDRLCRAALGPGRELLLPAPTFEMIARYARVAGGEVVEVPWGNTPYPAALVASRVTARTGLVAVVSPNNPTGRAASVDDLRAVSAAASGVGALVMLDQAYAEFADRGGEPLLAEALVLPNVITLRTLSKAWGLAGLRVGYAVGPEEVIGWLRAAGAPYAVSAPSLAIAERWLGEGQAAMEGFVGRIQAERGQLAGRLAGLSTEVYESEANFVFARFRDALWVRDALAGLGIGVRAFPGKPGLSDGLRITLPGGDASLARLSSALTAACAPEALLLDMDGVIADTSGSYRRAIVETARAFGVVATAAQVAAVKRAGDANNDWIVTARLLRSAGVTPPFEEVKARFEELYQGTPGRPGLCETERLLCERSTLEALASRLPLGIVTGRPAHDARAFLDRFGLGPLFRAVVTMEEAPLKPDPAPVRLCLDRLGVRAAWMVGDTPDDARAARGAGVVPLGVVAPGDEPAATTAALLSAGAARVLPSLGSLLEVLP